MTKLKTKYVKSFSPWRNKKYSYIIITKKVKYSENLTLFIEEIFYNLMIGMRKIRKKEKANLQSNSSRPRLVRWRLNATTRSSLPGKLHSLREETARNMKESSFR